MTYIALAKSDEQFADPAFVNRRMARRKARKRENDRPADFHRLLGRIGPAIDFSANLAEIAESKD